MIKKYLTKKKQFYWGLGVLYVIALLFLIYPGWFFVAFGSIGCHNTVCFLINWGMFYVPGILLIFGLFSVYKILKNRYTRKDIFLSVIPAIGIVALLIWYMVGVTSITFSCNGVKMIENPYYAKYHLMNKYIPQLSKYGKKNKLIYQRRYIGENVFGKDSYECSKMTSVDFSTFKVLNSIYGKDKNHVYISDRIIQGADPKTFVLLGVGYAKDKKHVFLQDRVIEKADPNTFQLIGSIYSKDKNYVYANWHIIPNKDPRTFKLQ